MLGILQYIILGISLAAPIGPVGVELIQRGLKNGFLSAFLVGLGAIFADITWALVAYFGLANFIIVPIIRTSVWFLGAFVLCYFGYCNLKEYFEEIDLEKSIRKKGKNSFATGYWIAISSPITVVWWVSVVGSIVGSQVSGVPSSALIGIMAIIVGILTWVLFISFLLHWGKRFVNQKTMRYISAVSGFILIGFGLYFAYSGYLSLR